MQNELILLDTDKTFRRILAVSFSFYVVLVIFIQLKGESFQMKPAPAVSETEEPPRVARLLVEPQKAPSAPLPPPTIEAPKKEPPKVEAPPVEKPIPSPPAPKGTPKVEKAETSSSPAPVAKAPPQEQVKKVGLLGLLGGKKGSGSPPAAGKGFSSLKDLPPPSAEKKPSSAAPSSSSAAAPLPSFAQEEIEKIRRRALTEQETKLTQTRQAVVQEDLSKTKITQEGGAGGGRNQEAISGIVHLNREKLQLLYNRQLQRKPELQGFLTVEFLISSQGQVLECRIVNSSLSDPIFEKEVVQEILRWKFPSAAQGTTTVLYPLSFSPAG